MLKLFFTFLLAVSSSVILGQDSLWVEQAISGSVSLSFPTVPGMRDTSGQKIYYLIQGKDMMLATVTPIPNTIEETNPEVQDSVLKNYIASVIEDATQLIYSPVNYKGIPAIFYKVRVDNPTNPIQGLITDSYNFIQKDTIYSISYLRYEASDLFDYNKQRKFFDKVLIHFADSTITADSLGKSPSTYSSTQKNSKLKDSLQFIGIAALIILITIGIYLYLSKKKEL